MSNPLRKPTTPGEVLREEYMKPLNLTHKTLAEASGLPEGSISPLLRGRGRVTYGVALRLGKCLGTTAQFWLNLQNELDHYQLQIDSFTWRQIQAIKTITEPLPDKPRSAGAGRPCSRK